MQGTPFRHSFAAWNNPEIHPGMHPGYLPVGAW